MSLFSFDCEADGPCPGLYSMIEMGMVVVTPTLDKTYFSTLKPMTEYFEDGALKAIGATREQTLAYRDPAEAMKEAVEWVEATSEGRPTFISDNNGFDWQFWNYYCHYYIGRNPFGFSSRRISDVYSGLTRNMRGGTKWKSLRKTAHTHNALDDAKGNAEALLEIGKRYRIDIE